MNTDLQIVLKYHEETKHHLDRYAKSLGYLDWNNQPAPFRFYEGSDRYSLLVPSNDDGPAYGDLFDIRREAEPVNNQTISRFFFDSMAISAWKQAPGMNPWALRVNPSSGNLHPTESYLASGPIQGLSDIPGVYHYNPYFHGFERRIEFGNEEWQALTNGLSADSFFVGLSSIYWRESWKYGERAFRYCNHDIGHAIAALTVSAACLGWSVRWARISYGFLRKILGLENQVGIEAEHPDCLLLIGPRSFEGNEVFHLPDSMLDHVDHWESIGHPNRLSREHHPWPIIESVAEATLHHDRVEFHQQQAADPFPVLDTRKDSSLSARKIIRRRRSAVAMDARTTVSVETFYSVMRRISSVGSPPFSTLPWPPMVDLLLFVHRVEGLAPGIYMLCRSKGSFERFQLEFSQSFDWKSPENCPSDLRIYRLRQGDFRSLSATISCHQNIASDGVFSAAMLAEFEPALRKYGAPLYPLLFWECGLIGQMLYLEAECSGIKGTGIGCFHDDMIHDLLGVPDRSWQSLYHFTVGGALEDFRLQTMPAYHHLQKIETES